MRGSTALAESMDPEEWTEIMNNIFEQPIEPVQRYQGTVARLMGDAILALFGAPVAHEDDPQRAVLAGLAIQENIQPFREKLQKEQKLTFNVRVGINTGLAVVGEVGSGTAVEYTAMLADSYGQTSIIFWAAGQIEDSIEAAHERVRISKSIGNEWNQAAGLSLLAVDHSELGEFGRAIAYAEEGLRITDQTGNFNSGGFCLVALISVYVTTGAWSLAQQQADRLYANRDKTFSLLRPMALAACAHVHIRQGRFIEAERILIEALEITNSVTMALVSPSPRKLPISICC